MYLLDVKVSGVHFSINAVVEMYFFHKTRFVIATNWQRFWDFCVYSLEIAESWKIIFYIRGFFFFLIFIHLFRGAKS